jgi:hypothetical protein
MEAQLKLHSWTRRARLLACLTAVSSIGAAAWLAQPGSAAPPATCHGHVSVATTAHDVDENALDYLFGCSTTVVGYSVFSGSKELSSYSPTAAVMNTDGSDATAGGSKEFECGGDLPGLAHNCTKGILKPGIVARGELGATDAPCTAEPVQWWLITVDDAGQVAGPFNMGKRTRGCPTRTKNASSQKKTQAKAKNRR